jgi:hypothetical protein
METFKDYVQDANRLCETVLGERDAARAKQKLTRMQEKISKSGLTVYQKYFLMSSLTQQLSPHMQDDYYGQSRQPLTAQQ